jgi:nucleotide-binding universal stress UspA family protein
MSITILDGSEPSDDLEIPKEQEPSGDRFVQWIRHRLREEGFPNGNVRCVAQNPGQHIEKRVRQEIVRDRYGMIVMGPGSNQAWQQRILYRECGKGIGWIGTHAFQEHAIVPIDFSDASILAMRFLHGAITRNPKITFTFCHVLTDLTEEYKKRWTIFKAIVGFDDPVPLKVVPLAGDVASVLIRQIQDGNYGTVILGKRGLSGTKRWLLGSVSRKVLKGLTNQSLFLIDW